jgi:hypothetical protein
LPRTDCVCLASRTMTGRAPQPVKLSRHGPSRKCLYAPPGDVALRGHDGVLNSDPNRTISLSCRLSRLSPQQELKWAIFQHSCSVRGHQSAQGVPDGTLGPTKSIGGPLVRTVKGPKTPMHGRLQENRRDCGASDVRGGVIDPEPHLFAWRSSYLSDRRARVVLATDAHVEAAA